MGALRIARGRHVGGVVIRGVKGGIETSMKVLVPLMMGLLVALAVYSMRNGDAGETVRFLFVPDTGQLTGRGVLDALGARNGLDAGSGPGLVFESLPVAFATMPAGRLVATAFFALLAIAALGSSISMLEAVVAVLDRRLGWTRRRAVIVGAGVCFVVGLATVARRHR